MTKGDTALDQEMEETGGEQSPPASPHPGSLFDDVQALIEDGKTYVDAELNYQRNRAKFSGSQIKTIAILAVLAVLAGFLFLIALTVGILVGLTPTLGIWQSTGIVAGAWLIVLALSGFGIVRAAKRISAAFKEDEK